MAELIQLRRGDAAEWAAANPVLAAGEPGVELDTGKQKIGDGTTAWNALPYSGGGGGTADTTEFTPTGTLAATDVQAALAELDTEKQAKSEKGQANGYASLGSDGKVPAAQLPSTGSSVDPTVYATWPQTNNLQVGTIDPSVYVGQNDAADRLAVPAHVAGDEATHPSVLHFPDGWNGYRYWMAFTPYPAGSDAAEDPNIAASQDGTTWTTPTGLTNPLDDQAGGSVYNSDTELAVSPDGTTLYCIWRTVDTTNETLYVRSTTDGVTWTAKQQILQVTKASANVLSPAIVHDGTQWVMWTVDAAPNPNTLVRRTATSITGTWSAPTTCTITGLPAGRDPWHVSVIKLGSQYVALLNDAASGASGSDGDLYLMQSADGLTWTCPSTPVISKTLAANYTAVYRGSLVPTYDAGRLTFDLWYGAWTSGATPRWGIYRRRLTRQAASTGGAGGTGDASWTTVSTLSNGWANYGNGYGTVAYRKDGQGFVHLRGVITGGTVAAIAFTLPAGYRPAAKTLHPAGSNGTTMGRIDVLTTGGVEIRGNGTVISLDGTTFLAEQ